MNLPNEDVEVNIFAPVNEHIFVPKFDLKQYHW